MPRLGRVRGTSMLICLLSLGPSISAEREHPERDGGLIGVGYVSAPEETSLRALYQQLLDGWNRGSGTVFASVFTEHADLITPGGIHIKGRERIASFHQTVLDGILKGSSLVGDVRSVRFLTDDIALVHAVGGLLRAEDLSGTPRRMSVHTMLAVRHEGRWLLEAFQSTPI